LSLRPFWRRQTPPVAVPSGLGRRFGDLKVRPKLIVLHNLFFLTLGCAVYFTLIPAFESRVASARAIEVSLVTELFRGDRPQLRLPEFESYDYREGAADDVQVPIETRAWLDANPGEVTAVGDFLYKRDRISGLYQRVTLPRNIYDEVVRRAELALFGVLGLIYVLAVALLELVIMPRYVYQPIRIMLDADAAAREGDREHELIADEFITDDEIGQIMRSRNEAVKELRRHEDELSQALSQLEAQDRLASLGQLSASVAHEMNTPLAVLHGSIEKLLETSSDAQTRQRLERMLRVTQRLRKISDGLVDFARVRKESMGPAPLKALIDEAWGLVSIDDKAAQVALANEIPEKAAVFGNGDRLVQVFLNVLRNALQAVAPGGHVWVRTRRYSRDGRCWYCIAVEDDGPGIPPDVLPSIFDAFVSSRLDAQGTGLGLTVAAGIVQQHEGQIHAANRPGGGARVEVVLPAAD
jgi:signal transduction histidine kinase